MTLFLSRLRLDRGADLEALRPLLDPGTHHPGAMDPHERGRRTDAHHRLIWTAFADHPDRRRDFLWRHEGAGAFTVLSAREPMASRLFEPPEVRPFSPVLEPGDHLAFALRANATRDRAGSGKGRRSDVVMHALRAVPAGLRDQARMDAAQTAGQDWLESQGARAGFRLLTATVGTYSVAALPGHVGRRKSQPQYGILDLTGVIEMTEPRAFLSRLALGFGRARAFGCGLMLIRRA